MELIIFWITTIILTIILELKNSFRIIKDIADAGYKFEKERLAEVNKEINPNAKKASFMTMLIPVINLLETMKRVISYNNSRDTILDGLNVLDVLEEMTELEKEEYKKNPTGLNAIIVPIKIKTKLENAIILTVNENDQESKIFYEYDENGNIIILKVDGPLSNYSNDKIIEIINMDREKMLDFIKEMFGTPDEFINSLKEEVNKENNITLEKEKLIELKNQIINSKEKEEKGPILSKRKDKLD